MTDQADVRVQRSRQALRRAILGDLARGVGDQLTIASVCATAGVSRPTFYQHYSSLEALLEESVRERLDELAARAEIAAPKPGGARLDYMTSVIADTVERIAGERLAYGPQLDGLRLSRDVHFYFEEWVRDRIEIAFEETDSTALDFAAAGIARAIMRRLREPTSVTTEQFARGLAMITDRALGGNASIV